MIKPLNSNILVKLIEKKEDKESDVLLPDNFDKTQESQLGEVVAVSAEIKKIKKGDKILFDKYAVSNVKIDDEKVYFVKYEEVLGIYEQDRDLETLRKEIPQPSPEEKDSFENPTADVQKRDSSAL